jgi:hypothetical protein
MKPAVHLYLLLLLVIATFLLSCNSEDISKYFTPTSTTVSTPLSGKTSVMGRVISKKTGLPLNGIDVWLAKVIRQDSESIYILDTLNSPSILTNEKGAFVIQNIDPGEYVIVIGNPEILYEIISEEPGQAKIWKLLNDTVIDVGDLFVSNFK